MTPPGELNGWTAKELDHLSDDVRELREESGHMRKDIASTKEDVSSINVTLAKMQGDETEALRTRVHELEGRPRAWLFAMGAPIISAVIAVALAHAF